ncbi:MULTISPECIES: dienelactone hydrolase family protein [Halomonadaceae]|uniref:dienelactone hydrolase family protein n=1 Tax=Halomonadaceae TaxID=28256 RepID=UPI00159880FF|nr:MULTISPECIES: dienelactone hydrolase family protein [Halomonas]QJQ95928.1 dienelactone hydrolase family protein [Halomonas sp. PA5]
MTTQWIDLTARDGGTFQGYLALPPAGKGPGIVLLQEIFGVNAHIRSVAEQYAQDGYVVLVPDLFWRQEPSVELGYDGEDKEKAFTLMKALDNVQAIDDISCAVTSLRARPECEGRVTSLGYCLGGRLSYLCALDGGVDAAVCFYPGGIANLLDRVPSHDIPLQFHFGGQDAHITQDHIGQVREAIGERGNVDINIYDDADHGFNCWARSAYHRHAAALSHGRTLSFIETVVN